MVIETYSQGFTRLFASNSTTTGTSFTGLVPTTTTPTGDGIITSRSTSFPAGGNQAAFIFYGTTTANQTMLAKVTGWSRIEPTGTSTTSLWIPVPLVSATVTLGAATGVAATDAVVANLFADTIVTITSFTSAVEFISPADDTVAMLKVDFCGCDRLQVQLVRNSSSASTNCLARVF